MLDSKLYTVLSPLCTFPLAPPPRKLVTAHKWRDRGAVSIPLPPLPKKLVTAHKWRDRGAVRMPPPQETCENSQTEGSGRVSGESPSQETCNRSQKAGWVSIPPPQETCDSS